MLSDMRRLTRGWNGALTKKFAAWPDCRQLVGDFDNRSVAGSSGTRVRENVAPSTGADLLLIAPKGPLPEALAAFCFPPVGDDSLFDLEFPPWVKLRPPTPSIQRPLGAKSGNSALD